MSDARVTVTLPDGSQKQTAAGTTIADFVREAIGPGLAKAAVLAKAGGVMVDLSRPLTTDTALEIFTTKSAEALDTIRHDAAHVVADAVQRLFPGTQVTIGPSIEHGFYYDFDRGQPFTEDELAQIEAEANRIVAADLPFRRTVVAPAEAVALFTGKGEAFKVEIIHDIIARGATELSLYHHGEWTDFCEGPHGPSTGRIGVIKILSSSAAYWRGDHRNKSLQRVYGTAFFDKKALDAWLAQRAEAEKRDHRRLGKELDLFHFHPFSPGAAFWTPKGTAIYQVLSNYMRQLALGNGYVEIKTPLIYNKGLWEISGHWGKYKENMFLIEDSEARAAGESEPYTYSLKPMNCPSHHVFYGFKKQSYRDLPLRLHSQDVLHRNEAAGSLGGLTRVRQFAQDDAHIYCREDQIADEVKRFVTLLDKVYAAVGLTYTAKFATRPPQRIGDDAMWDRAEASLKSALDGLGLAYELKPGDGAFYGPKIDFDVSDSIGRKWQLGTIQLDYAAPERFDLTYVGQDGKDHRPVVLHRAIYGSFERFIAILVEHFAGAFPLWLAPIQVALVTVTDRINEYAQGVARRLEAAGARVMFDDGSAHMQAKVREASLQKIPYTLVLGDKEQAADTVSVRTFGNEQAKMVTMSVADFVAKVTAEARLP
ncbi:MAG: threonine--tRNA ligase [Kofleriaceae bacterium]|nr:threonine--tRNA ligase [Kofleriaceae bacterium]MBP6835840.1 threonine--tRNA ligase [Kofleriaceae bacterium]